LVSSMAASMRSGLNSGDPVCMSDIWTIRTFRPP
jgi:hypothetical protein